MKKLILILIMGLFASVSFADITKVVSEEMIIPQEEVYKRTWTIEQSEEFTIKSIDRRIEDYNRGIATYQDEIAKLEAKKAEALNVK